MYIWLRIPETRSRSYGELDMLFEHRVPAWRFKGTKVDQFNAHDNLEKPEVQHYEPSPATVPGGVTGININLSNIS